MQPLPWKSSGVLIKASKDLHAGGGVLAQRIASCLCTHRNRARGGKKSLHTAHFTPNKSYFISFESTKHKRPGKCLPPTLQLKRLDKKTFADWIVITGAALLKKNTTCQTDETLVNEE